MVPCASAGATGARARTTIETSNARSLFMENPVLDRAKEGPPGVNELAYPWGLPAIG
jgi:hypothetical protein